ncbi:MAG: hypothetical protein IPI34_05190 [bacterium]|nr:hypothetical protein [bacterium]
MSAVGHQGQVVAHLVGQAPDVAVEGRQAAGVEARQHLGRQQLVQRQDQVHDHEGADLVRGAVHQVGAAHGHGRGLELGAQILGVVVGAGDADVGVFGVGGLEFTDVLLEQGALAGVHLLPDDDLVGAVDPPAAGGRRQQRQTGDERRDAVGARAVHGSTRLPGGTVPRNRNVVAADPPRPL